MVMAVFTHRGFTDISTYPSKSDTTSAYFFDSVYIFLNKQNIKL